jgi:hypothetical protein
MKFRGYDFFFLRKFTAGEAPSADISRKNKVTYYEVT